MKKLEVFAIRGFPEVEAGADVAALFLQATEKSRVSVRSGDVLVIKQKVVSKAEGRLVWLDDVKPRAEAIRLAVEHGKDPKLVEVILGEAVRVVRAGHGVIITETRHGFVCANSGVDRSNVKDGYAVLLPLDPDASARRIRVSVEGATGKRVGVVVTDTFGRPWRKGQTDVAIGCSGIDALFSYRGRKDRYGYELRVTEPAVVDEIAGAAELATGKLTDIPAAIVRGATYTRGEAGARSIVMEKERDLFR
jgi:coenzyme F420-0:L-glutamate ligase/coenzyme F420-1:gamma-L-glutamate ligase